MTDLVNENNSSNQIPIINNNNKNENVVNSNQNNNENVIVNNETNQTIDGNLSSIDNTTITTIKTNKEDNKYQSESSVLIESQMNSITDTVNNSEQNNYGYTSSLNNNMSNRNTSDASEKDVNYLHNQVKKLQKLLLSEQDKFTKLQKRLQDSENQRLEIISANNKEIFGLNSQCTKLRAELEKSEAMRQSIEYELTVARNSFNKERNIILEKEKVLEEINKNLEEKYNMINNENVQLKGRLQIIDNEYSAELTKIRTSLDEKQRFLDKFQTEQDLFEKERQTLNSFIKDQDNIILQIKDDLNSQKELIKKLSTQLDSSKEKEERYKKDNESLANRVKVLDEEKEKEKTLSLERKYNFEILQVKHKEALDQLRTHENIKVELELNISKLIEQLKENRKELSDEQMRNREIKERFKICETQFKTLNSDLSQKLEEKTNTIKSLSKQLSAYEANLNEIKYELSQTKDKQSELDAVYHNCMKDIEFLIKSFTVKDDDMQSFKLKQNNLLKSTPVICPTLVDAINRLKITLDDYKRHASQAFDQLRESKYQIDSFHNEYDKFKQIIDSKEKILLQCEDIKSKQENEMNTLRKERVALEEVINSLRLECETLKTSLNREYETNDSSKKQINRLNKSFKQIEEQKANFLQSLYKRLVPVLNTNKLNNPTATTNAHNLNEQNLENIIENAIINLINSIQKYDENLNEIELKLKQKETINEETAKKQEEQIKNLTKLLKEKETIFNKQKESLVNYYEQLINDVNSRVKHTQSTVSEAWDKLKDTDNFAKNLDNECAVLKESLNKSQNQIKNLNTSCSLLIGILVPLMKKNKELKEQRKIFEYLYKRLIQFQNQIILLNDQNNNIYDKTDHIKFTNFIDTNIYLNTNFDESEDDAEEMSNDNLDAEADVDENKKKFKKKIERLLNENDLACGNEVSSNNNKFNEQKNKHLYEQLNESRLFAKQQLAIKLNTLSSNKCSKICLFRKVTIAILAAHRLIYFYNSNLNTSLNVSDSIDTRYKFLFSQPTVTSKFQLTKSKSDFLKTILANEYDENENQISHAHSKKLYSWLTSSKHILLLTDIGHELNRYLYGEESYNNKWDLDDNLVKTTKQCVLKCFSLLENIFSVNSILPSDLPYLMTKDSNTLCQRLKQGLNRWINQDSKIARHFSFDKKIQLLNEHLFELNQRYLNTKMDHDLLKTKLQMMNNENCTVKTSKTTIKTLEDELGVLRKKHNEMIPAEKFETVCKELELALNREQQAEIILNQQSVQLQELSQKLGEFSNQELQSFKLKEAIGSLKIDVEKKDKMIKSLNKKLSGVQAINQNLENSARKTIIDRDVLVGYCQSIDNIIQNSLKPLISTSNFYEVIRLIKQINHLDIISQTIQISDGDYYKPSSETVACHNLVATFCENYECVLNKAIETENEMLLLRRQITNLKDELKDALKPDYKNYSLQSPTKFTPLEIESDISFRPLPNFTIHDERNSAFKPFPIKLVKSSTPTSNNSSLYS